MKPILLQGHTRPLTSVKYNREGDLIFSTAKDHHPCAWYSHNGEMLGTYIGHSGSVWCLDVNALSTLLLTGAGDNTARLWNVQTGKCLFHWKTDTAVRAVQFSTDGRKAMMVTDSRMGFPCTIRLIRIPNNLGELSNVPLRVISIQGSKVTVAAWSLMDTHIYTGHEDGSLCSWDANTGELVHKTKPHKDQITDLQMSPDRSYFVTSSKDHSALLINADPEKLTPLKRYQTERPVNSVTIVPGREYIILGGGQEAMQVTTTSTRTGKFEVRFFSKIFEMEIGRVKGHFGPINTVAASPDGLGFASGGEDGYVRVHHFDEDYYKFEIPI